MPEETRALATRSGPAPTQPSKPTNPPTLYARVAVTAFVLYAGALLALVAVMRNDIDAAKVPVIVAAAVFGATALAFGFVYDIRKRRAAAPAAGE